MKSVLVVEDDKNQRLLYQEELGEEGYEVIVARDGAEALNAMKAKGPDLVVMDMKMPGLGGLELMNRIADMNRDLPIVVNTAYGAYKNNWRNMPADAYVVKSSDLSELKMAVKKLLHNN